MSRELLNKTRVMLGLCHFWGGWVCVFGPASDQQTEPALTQRWQCFWQQACHVGYSFDCYTMNVQMDMFVCLIIRKQFSMPA